ncbi:MAG: ParB/RepB/Spo0J family partition protein [Erysipelotrichaceae bacterium]|nr:ParB/RepB/Spo0J family partition protein [Erysipelotrichaceae bacterium]MDD6093081.1 ParB/RepB/Spo0J family partition protein [bacterium]MDY3934175.1 ParB/RepB/Spo0J family partition protein [Bacilli bacterium]
MEQKNKALGRGLEQLFASEVLDFDSFESNILDSADENDVKEINLSEIRSNPYQPRKTFNDEALHELAESIKNYGVFQPIIVKKSIKGYDLIAGERRVRASKLAGLDKIPAIIKDFSDDMMREIALLENLQRENLTAIELAWAYKGIIDSLHITQDELANKLGKSRSSITNVLGLLRLPTKVQDMILEGKISMGHARELSKLDDNELILKYAKEIVDKGLSVREVELMVKMDEVRKKNPINRIHKDNEYKYVEKELREFFGTKVRVKDKKIEISFENANDLDRILEIIDVKLN